MPQGERLSLKDAQSLLDAELQGWTIKIITSGGGLCVYAHNEIWIDHKHMNMPFILHEVAHAKLPSKAPLNFHDWEWGDLYTALMEKYFVHDLNTTPQKG